MFHWFERIQLSGFGSMVIVISSLLVSNCATVNENPRAKMSPGEGRYHYEAAAPDMSKNQIYDKVMEWVAANYASFQEVKELKGKGVLMKSLAPVPVYGRQRHVTYTITIKTFPKKIRIDFATGSFHDGQYPAVDSLPRVERYYQKIRNEILRTLGLSPAAVANPEKPAASRKTNKPKAKP